MKRFAIIPLLLCLLVSISSCTKAPKLESIDSVYISIKEIVYNDIIYKEVRVTINNPQLFEFARNFQISIDDYRGKEGINLAPWSVDIEYVLSNGEKRTFSYSKSGNDTALFGELINLDGKDGVTINYIE